MVKFSDVEMISCVLFGVWRGCLVSMAGGVAVLLRSETTLEIGSRNWKAPLKVSFAAFYSPNCIKELVRFKRNLYKVSFNEALDFACSIC